MRTLIAILAYSGTFALLWAGMKTAPLMGWPKNDVEIIGSILVTMGMLLKFVGHWALLSHSPRVNHV